MSVFSKATTEDFAYARAAEMQSTTPEHGVTRTLGAHNPKLLVVQNRLDKDWIGKTHSHPHDQAVYVVSGHLRVTCAGQIVDLKTDDSFVVAGGIDHQVTALEESVAIDLFTPCRDEFLK